MPQFKEVAHMMFTVNLPGGIRDYEFESYVRMLEKDGVDIANARRVFDPQTDRRWLYGWTSREDAERFAIRLREDSENSNWQVYELSGVEPTQGPLGPIEIMVGEQSDGCAYGLNPTSEKLVRRRFPHATLAPSLFISSGSRNGSRAAQDPIMDQIAIILTGLPEHRIAELGGYRVYDPVSRRVLRESPNLAQ